MLSLLKNVFNMKVATELIQFIVVLISEPTNVHYSDLVLFFIMLTAYRLFSLVKTNQNKCSTDTMSFGSIQKVVKKIKGSRN